MCELLIYRCCDSSIKDVENIYVCMHVVFFLKECMHVLLKPTDIIIGDFCG